MVVGVVRVVGVDRVVWVVRVDRVVGVDGLVEVVRVDGVGWLGWMG